jgi:hypothetical protein
MWLDSSYWQRVGLTLWDSFNYKGNGTFLTNFTILVLIIALIIRKHDSIIYRGRVFSVFRVTGYQK